MSEKYYILRLDDPAKPGFCTFDKMYVGTEETILQVASNLEKAERYTDTVTAIRSYFKGNLDAEHNIAYRNQKVLIPIKIEKVHKTRFANYKWTHTNIWGFPYEMKCDSAIIHQIVFRDKNKIYRCIRAWLKNLCYESFGDTWNPLDSGFWGNASILDVAKMPNAEDFIFNNLLYVEEEQYDDLSTAINVMLVDENIKLQRICDEIFADG